MEADYLGQIPMSDLNARLTAALADRYRIERELGAGGMATVYLAHDVKHDRKVALKVLKPELAAVLGADRFVQEIKTTASLQHPHILPLFDSGEADSFLYYVMPYIEGETLREKLDRETQLGIDEAVKLTTEVADALQYAHEQGVVHRDIKPENILLHNNRPMVADFGIALAVSAAAGGRMTETGLSLGTPHYMSPEQATAERDVTNRSDIYSLGAVLYEMLTGDPPHTGSTAQQIVMKIIAEEAAPVTEARKSVPANVAAAVAKSLEKLPADRFASAALFAEAMTDSTYAPGATAAAGSGTSLSSSGISPIAFGTVCLAALVFLVMAIIGWRRPEPSKQVSRYMVAFPGGEPMAAGQVGARVAVTPDGSKLVYVGLVDGQGQLWMRERSELNATPLPGTAGAFAPFVAPDGRNIGFLTQGPVRVLAASLSGGPPITVIDSGVDIWGASWGPDGFIYASTLTAGIARRLATGEGPLQLVTKLDSAMGETRHLWPETLPNGKGVVFSVHHGSNLALSDIAVADLETGTHEIVVRGVVARYAASGHLAYVTVDGTLMVVPFDQDKLERVGDPVAIVDSLQVAAFGTTDLAVSASGMLVYSTGDQSAQVEPVWVTRDGRYTPIDEGWVGDFRYPALSPDGSRLALSIVEQNVQHLYSRRLDRDGAPVTRITHEGTVNFRPSWSPTGDTIAFISDRGRHNSMYVKPGDGSGQATLLLGAEGEAATWEVEYTGIDDWILYRVEGEGSDLYAAQLHGDGKPLPLVTTEANERMATLSPDGRWLAYTSNRSDNLQVVVRPFPNVADGQWQVSRSGGHSPRWAHSGRELFYRNDVGDFISVPVSPSRTSFDWGEEEVLFSTSGFAVAENRPQYDVAPDDQRFLMLRFTGVGDPDRLIVVENWFEELKENGDG